MPPRKGIVRSGNAGNSSKPSKALPPTTGPTNSGEKPLFPPGSKFPLSLLHERCRKNGWEKAVVDTRPQQDGWSFVVTLSRLNKKTFQKETVRLEPHPPYLKPTAMEARHWGATYALYRFCNGIQLHLVLPPGPREYWTELAAEHKAAPQHMEWMWDADPFAARKTVDERQVKAAKKQEAMIEASSSTTGGDVALSREFANSPEVKMASSLREQVENAVKQAMALYPETGGSEGHIIPVDDQPALLRQLGHLGFRSSQAKDAITFFSQPSPLTSNLLQGLDPLEALIEYLILHVPECDLPQRFLPTKNTSSSFVTSAHAGTDDLKRRWLIDRAVKEAGWPALVVKRCIADPRLAHRWELLIESLGIKLLGLDFRDLIDEAAFSFQKDPEDTRVKDEIEAVQSVYVNAYFSDSSQELVIPLRSAPLQLHIVMSPRHPYPDTDRLPPMFISSTSIPAYVRLHCLSKCLEALKELGLVGTGEGICFTAAELIEEEWLTLEREGPPDMSNVMRNLMAPQRSTDTEVDTAFESAVVGHKGSKKRGGIRRDDRTDASVKTDFEKTRNDRRYSEMFQSRQRLPAFKVRDEFLEALEKSRVVVVVGETGCGKTTQLPQYILDSLILSGRGATASIIITQPRRISALSVAARVSSERIDDGSVGYAIRGDSRQDNRTKLLFCTTGVVLRRLGGGDALNGVTHIIIDEVHERSVDGDFLLLELRELLKKQHNLKVILMSATINHETFVAYFNNAPLIYIPGFTHPVTDLYLEDVISQIQYRPPASRSTKKETEQQQRDARQEFSAKGLNIDSINALQNLSKSERIDFQLVAAVVDLIVSQADKAKERGAILIFMPGVQEIRQCIDAIRNFLSSSKADILPLHANLSSNEQRQVFDKIGKWKIVVATNVAETSITIDDVVYVIDAGKVKETDYDPESGLSRLVEKWVTRAAAKQRRGRAGRTRPGVCYKLYTRRQEGTMDAFPIPEILRVPLESVLLTVKVMRDEEDAKLFLRRAIDPPDVVAIDAAWSVLEELGAIDDAGKLTALGQHMSLLPVDLRLAKMLVLGTIFRCLGPILTVAACLSSKPLFLSPMDKRQEASNARARFSTASSDLLTDCRAFDECMQLRTEGKTHNVVRVFCDENFISQSALRDIDSLRQDFVAALSDMGFIPMRSKPAEPSININSGQENLIKAVIVGGLWPRVARVSLPKSAIKFDKVQSGTVQRDNIAKEFKIFDLKNERVFLHPSSILFSESSWKTPFLAYFRKNMTSKVFLRDATVVPFYALLLFGGPVSVNHIGGGLTIGSSSNFIKLKAWPRIGVLANQLRRLLDAQLQRSIEQGSVLISGKDNPVLPAMLALLSDDGLSRS